MRRAIRRLGAIAALVIAAGCVSSVVAPPPPPEMPALTEDFAVAGVPVAVAAKAARTLALLQYTTRRFGADSTWGYRSVDSFHVRLRYVRPSGDSTRVVAEYWGRCEKGGVSCLRGEFVLLASGVATEEGPPQ